MKKHRRTVTFMKQKSYLLASVLMLAAVFGMTGVYVSEQKVQKRQQEMEQVRQAEEQDRAAGNQDAADNAAGNTAEAGQVIPPESDDFLDTPEVVSSQEENPAEQDEAEETEETGDTSQETPDGKQEDTSQETASNQVKRELHFDGAQEMGWPLEGNVIMNYSMDQTIYFATLDQYKYNPALVIQGTVNDKVRSVADGKVTNIETNEVTGCTVTVELGDGYSAVYGQLKEVPLEAGAYVEAGTVVGYVNEPTKYYSVEGSNLYFQMIKDNTSVDPMEFLQ